MNKKTEKWAMIAVLAATMTGGSFAEEVKGRDVVAAGTLRTVSGTLKPEGGHDWFLITDDGTFELHLGPGRFRADQGFKMSEGEQAEVTGFVHEGHMAPITLTIKRAVTLRNEEGRPLWAGTDFGGKGRAEDLERPGREESGEERGRGVGRNRR